METFLELHNKHSWTDAADEKKRFDFDFYIIDF